jgi:catalase
VVIAAHGGAIEGDDGSSLEVTKSALTTQSVEYDAVVVAGGSSALELAGDPYLAVNLGEAFRHYKTVGAWGDGIDVLAACSIPSDASGVVTAPKGGRSFVNELIEAIGWHRHWDRPTLKPAART